MPKIVDHDERRRLIVEALWRVVSRDGAAGVSVRSIAAEAGMSKTSIGHYAGSQDQLLALAVTQMVAHVTNKAMSIDMSHLTLESTIETAMLLIPTTADRRQQSEIWLLLLSHHHSSAELRSVLYRLNKDVYEGIESMLRVMQEQGLVPQDADIAAEAAQFHAIVDGLSLQTLTDPEFMPSERVRAIITNHLTTLAGR